MTEIATNLIKKSSIRKRHGRPGKLTEAMIVRLSENIAAGLTFTAACARSGVDYSTFQVWRNRAEVEQDGIYNLFSEAIKAAEAAALSRLEETVTMVALGGQIVTEKRTTLKDGKVIEQVITEKRSLPDGRLALAMLERRNPEAWGKREPAQEPSEPPVVTVTIRPFAGEGGEQLESLIAAMNSTILPPPEED